MSEVTDFDSESQIYYIICASRIVDQDQNSQNFLGKFIRFFITLRCFYGVVIHRK